MISIHFSLKMDWINSKYKPRIKQKQIGEYIQTINIEFEFKDIFNLSSVYSKFIHWIYKPMATLRAMYRRPKLWDYHMRKVGVCRRESGGGVGHFPKMQDKIHNIRRLWFLDGTCGLKFNVDHQNYKNLTKFELEWPRQVSNLQYTYVLVS